MLPTAEERLDAIEREVSVVTERLEHVPTWPKLAAFGSAVVAAAWILMLVTSSITSGEAKTRANEAISKQEKHEEKVHKDLVEIRADVSKRLDTMDAKVGGIYQHLIENRPREAVQAEVRRAVGQMP